MRIQRFLGAVGLAVSIGACAPEGGIPDNPPLEATITAIRDSADVRILSVTLTNPHQQLVEIEDCPGTIQVFRNSVWEDVTIVRAQDEPVCTGETTVIQADATVLLTYLVSGTSSGERVRFRGEGGFVVPGSPLVLQPVTSDDVIINGVG